MSTQSVLSPANAAYLEALYEQFLADPDSVDQNLRTYFATFDEETPTAAASAPTGSHPTCVERPFRFRRETKCSAVVHQRRAISRSSAGQMGSAGVARKPERSRPRPRVSQPHRRGHGFPLQHGLPVYRLRANPAQHRPPCCRTPTAEASALSSRTLRPPNKNVGCSVGWKRCAVAHSSTPTRSATFCAG